MLRRALRAHQATSTATTAAAAGVRRLQSTSALVPTATAASSGHSLIPEDVVRELNKHIVGQEEAKKAVAIALRNRWRRRQLTSDALRDEISPMNILMSGPTGSGKTEIARRLAKISAAPFLKVEATRFTEVGIYGANAESMVKDLVDVAVAMARADANAANAAMARARAIDRLVELLGGASQSDSAQAKLREQIINGQVDQRRVRVTLRAVPKKQAHHRSSDMMMEMPPELENMMGHLDTIMKSRFGSGGHGTKDKGSDNSQEMSVKDALPRLEAEEADLIIDEDAVVKHALENVQHNGILFLDEIDKLAAANDMHSGGGGGGAYRKGEGVQKELLALTEGSAVQTRYGLVHTDHILFIASGAFHRCQPSDLLPELQGRLPIRVALSPLGAAEFERILTETEHNLLTQMQALLATEGVDLQFTEDAIREIAQLSAQVNSQTDDIGARRLATIVSKILEDVSFHAPKMNGVAFQVDKAYVQQRLANVLEKTDLTKYIL